MLVVALLGCDAGLASDRVGGTTQQSFPTPATGFDLVEGFLLLVTNRGIDHLLRNEGGSFEVTLGIEGGPYYHVGGTWGDVDHDDDLDLAVLTHSASAMEASEDDPGDPKELWEQTDDGWVDHDHWLEFVPRRFGVVVGAIVDVEAGEHTWRRWVLAGQHGAFCSGPPEVHVGLGRADRVDRVRVTWPDGSETTVQDVAVDQRLVVGP